jgi:hypothetical protein
MSIRKATLTACIWEQVHAAIAANTAQTARDSGDLAKAIRNQDLARHHHIEASMRLERLIGAW